MKITWTKHPKGPVQHVRAKKEAGRLEFLGRSPFQPGWHQREDRPASCMHKLPYLSLPFLKKGEAVTGHFF